MSDTTIETRVTDVESEVFQHGARLSRLVREVRISVREVGDRVSGLEARMERVEGLLERIAAKLEA